VFFVSCLFCCLSLGTHPWTKFLLFSSFFHFTFCVLFMISIGNIVSEAILGLTGHHEHAKSAPRGSTSAPCGPTRAPGGSLDPSIVVLRRLPGAPSALQERPKRIQERPQRPQGPPKRTQERPKSAPRRSKSTPSRHKTAPRGPKSDPRGSQEAPESPAADPTALPDSPRAPQADPRPPQEDLVLLSFFFYVFKIHCSLLLLSFLFHSHVTRTSLSFHSYFILVSFFFCFSLNFIPPSFCAHKSHPMRLPNMHDSVLKE
jgi:hypothetical protein